MLLLILRQLGLLNSQLGIGRWFDCPRAVRIGERLCFRLRPDIVTAALRTPDTDRTAAGPDWIVLTAAGSDEFTLDRATAWFETAWRLAGEATERPQRPD